MLDTIVNHKLFDQMELEKYVKTCKVEKVWLREALN